MSSQDLSDPRGKNGS